MTIYRLCPTCGNLLPQRGNCGCRPPSPQRHARSSALYQRQRRLALTRDQHRCTSCHTTTQLEVHHINGDATDHHLDNLTTLCRNCHVTTSRFLRHAVSDPSLPFRETHSESGGRVEKRGGVPSIG